MAIIGSNEDDHQIEKDEKVFGPDGFGVVMKTRSDKALVKPIRSEETKVKAFEFDELELIDEAEWVVYDNGPTEVPHR